ncbi:MAG: ATPase, T2SS/T4P/T4SS family [Patescibacteria group bacterium]
MIKTNPPVFSHQKNEDGQTSKLLEDRLVEITLKEKENIVQEQALEMGLPYVNLRGFAIAPDALALIPEERAKAARAVCYVYTPHREIHLATVDPHGEHFLELVADLGHTHKASVSVALMSEQSLSYAFELYRMLPKIYVPMHGVDIPEDTLKKFKESITNVMDLTDKFSSVSLTDLIVLLMAASIAVDASDVHIEAEESGVAVRFRIDGILHTVATIDRERYHALVSRLKLLSGLKINVEDRPQDGRATLNLEGERVDVRVSTLPTAFGESIVMRLLRGEAIRLSFDDLGFGALVGGFLKKEVERPNGMIVVCGPTGSGKTTTLYAILRLLNDPSTKIITIEDPIEYKLEGINQSQVDPSHDYTFANGLRSIVRQDPDVILVGEMRDLETVDIALQAALTGHLVFSTLHTNDAAGAIPRFLSMGAKPYLLAPALSDVLAQRLVRRVCSHCALPGPMPQEYAERVQAALSTLPPVVAETINKQEPKYVTTKGCPACQGIGYKGRIGIYELLRMSSDIERVILSGAISEYQIRDLAAKAGMVTMLQDGILKAMQGITTIDEVFRVAQ